MVLGLVLALSSSLCLPAHAAGVQFQPSDQERLERGEAIVVFKAAENARISLVQGAIICEAPMDLVWSVIVDYPAYPRFFHDMDTVKVLEHSGYSARLRILTNNLWPYPDFDYVLRVAPNPTAWTLNWKMEEGNLKTLYGSCALSPAPKHPNKTLVVYSLVQDPGWLVPRLSSEMSNRSLVIERLLALRQEVRNRKKVGRAQPPNVKPQWRKALFWWEKEPQPDPTIDELFNPPFAEPEPKPEPKPAPK